MAVVLIARGLSRDRRAVRERRSREETAEFLQGEWRVVGCFAGDALAGVALLQGSVELWWWDRPTDEAAYAHKVVVSRAFAGTGVVKALFAQMESSTLGVKRALLRLDTPAHRPPLIALCERLEFTTIDERTVGGLVARRVKKTLTRGCDVEDVIAVRVTLEDGESLAFMTWGRLFDAVDETEILDAVEKALPTYGIRAWSTIAVCDNLGEVANERYFYEALLSFAWKAPPSGKRHASWQSKKRKLVKAGRNIYFLGRPK